MRTYLLNHMDKPHLVLPQFVNKAADKLMELAPEGSKRYAMRKAYVQDLVHELVATNKLAPRLMLEGVTVRSDSFPFGLLLGIEPLKKDAFKKKRDHISSAEEDVNNMLAAAATMVNLIAARH
jgi:hypothetical protein